MVKEGVLGQKKVKRMTKWVREQFFLIENDTARRHSLTDTLWLAPELAKQAD
jgi:hypothetical protein